jgi:hypothetical protein
MIAGNIGSDAIMSYTVIGDAVNLGSRLESLNKQYGTRIIVSGATRARLSRPYQLRPLGEVVVKARRSRSRFSKWWLGNRGDGDNGFHRRSRETEDERSAECGRPATRAAPTKDADEKRNAARFIRCVFRRRLSSA